jgi:hypothetical protein
MVNVSIKLIRGVVCALFLALIAACGTPTPTATPAPTVTLTPTRTLQSTPRLTLPPPISFNPTNSERRTVVRLLNAIQRPYDVAFNGSLIGSSLIYARATDPISVTSGTYTLRIVPDRNGVNFSNTLTELSVTLEPRQSVVIVIHGAIDKPSVTLLNNTIGRLPKDTGRINFAHVINTPDLINMSADGGATTFVSLSAAGKPETRNIPIGESRFTVTRAANTNVMASQPLQIEQQKVYFMILFGDPNVGRIAVITEQAEQEASLTIVHANLPFPNAIDVYLDDQLAASAIPYSTSSPPLTVSARRYQLQVVPAGAKVEGRQLLYSSPIDLLPNQNFWLTLVPDGTVKTPQGVTPSPAPIPTITSVPSPTPSSLEIDEEDRTPTPTATVRPSITPFILPTVTAPPSFTFSHQLIPIQTNPTAPNSSWFTVLNGIQTVNNMIPLLSGQPITGFRPLPFGGISESVSLRSGSFTIAFRGDQFGSTEVFENRTGLILEAGYSYVYIVTGSAPPQVPLLLKTEVGVGTLQSAQRTPDSLAIPTVNTTVQYRVINTLMDDQPVSVRIGDQVLFERVAGTSASARVQLPVSSQKIIVERAGKQIGSLDIYPVVGKQLAILINGTPEKPSVNQVLEGIAPTSSTAIVRVINAFNGPNMRVTYGVATGTGGGVTGSSVDRPIPTERGGGVTQQQAIEPSLAYLGVGGEKPIFSGTYSFTVTALGGTSKVGGEITYLLENGKRYDLILQPGINGQVAITVLIE